MSNTRIETLRNLLEQNPKDSFARYGLAMEYAKENSHEEAVAEFLTLISFDPDYLYAYFHCGQSLEKLGRIDEAREIYSRGVEAAGRKGDAHARDELQDALEQLG
jgi:tetratricopeptide (TPR) repeat protein